MFPVNCTIYIKKITLILCFLLFGAVFSVYAQDNGASDSSENTALIESEIEAENEESKAIDDNEILFVDRTQKGDPVFYKNALITGMFASGLGTLLGISTLSLATINGDSTDLTNAQDFDTFHTYDYLFLVSSVLLVSGVSAVYIGASYANTDGTVKSYKKWKRQQILTGLITTTLGAGLMATGAYFLTTNESGEIEANSGIPLGVGAAIVLSGVPSLIVGLGGVF